MANSGAFKNNSLVTYIVGDASQFEKTLKKATNDVNTFQKNVAVAGKKNEASGLFGGQAFGRGSKFNQGLRGLASGTGLGSAALFGSGPFIGAALSAGAFKTSIDAASNLNEQLTKSQAVFGASDKAILKWSQDTARNLGISQRAALEAAGTFGNLFKAQGFSSGRNSQLSRSLVQLASDLASFNNVDPAQVLQDLNSAIVGEIEPVRKYGVDLRVARVQQEALAETGKENVKQLTRQELSLARINILFKDTAAAQGDFKRTQGGLANQERILSAQVENLASNLGTLLLPATKGMVTGINDLLVVTIKATGALKSLASVKIPPIHIPFFFDFPGAGGKGGVGSKIAGAAGKFGGLQFISPAAAVFEAVKGVHDAITGTAKQATTADTPKLASEFGDILGGFTSNAINDSLRAGGFIKPNKKIDAKGFKSILEGLGLKLDKADLTSSLTDNISILKTTATRLREEIAAGIDVKNAQKQLVAVEKQLQEAKSASFSNFIEKLQLGVDKAQLSGSLQAQISALQVVEAGLQKQIKAGVDVVAAQRQLVGVQQQVADLQGQIKQNSIDKILGGLQLAVDRAQLSGNLKKELGALEAQRDGIKAQIKAGNDVANNQSQLVSVLGAIQAKRQEIAQAAQEATQGKQFRALGLSKTGDEIVPGLKNLSSRISETLKKVSTGELNISSKLAGRLKAAQKLIKTEGKNLTETTRNQINEFIKAANGDNSKEKLTGPLTATTSLNTNKVLQGLGLDPAAARELKARLSKFNSAGVGISAGVAAQAQGVAFGAGASSVVVNVELDGQKVAKSVTVHQQKKARSNPPQKRGTTGARS